MWLVLCTSIKQHCGWTLEGLISACSKLRSCKGSGKRESSRSFRAFVGKSQAHKVHLHF